MTRICYPAARSTCKRLIDDWQPGKDVGVQDSLLRCLPVIPGDGNFIGNVPQTALEVRHALCA